MIPTWWAKLEHPDLLGPDMTEEQEKWLIAGFNLGVEMQTKEIANKMQRHNVVFDIYRPYRLYTHSPNTHNRLWLGLSAEENK